MDLTLNPRRRDQPSGFGPGTVLCAMLCFALAAAGSAFAQEEPACVGFQERGIMEGGTNGAAAVVAADLDGDGHMDIITASSNDDTIAWYKSNGGVAGEPQPGEVALAFERRVITTRADGVISIHAVDVDGDDDVDVLAASANDNTIALYENVGVEGSVAFVRQVLTASARRALSVYAADVDGDSDVDVLSASFSDSTIAWYENPMVTNTGLNPDGGNLGFTRRIVSTNAANASAVFAIDLDGDGTQQNPDIDVVSASIGDDKIAWYENVGINTDDPDSPFLEFTEHVVTRLADGARSVFAADVDGDGDIDILSASVSDDTVAWYDNPTFERKIISSASDGAKSVFATDLDGDGDIDVVVAAEKANSVYWFENVGVNDDDPDEPFLEFTQHAVSTDVTSADAVFAADVDGDGPIDVLSASSVTGAVSDDDKVAWFRNSGDDPPAWTEDVIASAAEGLNALFLADIDGDLEDDLIAATTTDQIVWYKISGGADPVFNRNLIAGADDGVRDPRTVFAFDIDGDGDQDILSGSAGSDRILWHENLRLPSKAKRAAGMLEFSTRVIAADADSVESIFVADLDGDGDGDVVSATSGDDTVAWYENPCQNASCPEPQTFNKRYLSSGDDLLANFRTLAPRSVFAVNVNPGAEGDLDIDVVTASSGDDKISIFESDGASPPEFVERVVASANPSESVFREEGAFSVSATDLDEDGDVDLLVAASSAGRISWYEREADPENAALVTYTQHIINEAAPLAVFVGFADVDGDGDQDVLATTLGSDRVLWHENRLEDRTDPEDPLLFTAHFVNFDGANPRSVVARDVDADDDLDLLVGFRFRSSWFEQIGELCGDFDVDGDGAMNGVELAWIGRAFGLSSAMPETQWWFAVDYNQDGVVDGLDLAILSSPGVWGESIADCSYTCQ